jgi:hypothetical protein
MRTLNLRNINPMIRAIGTMGAVAALVGGVTFAAQSSNTVMLTDNTLASSTAALAISSGAACGTTAPTATTAAGMNFNSLVPGTASAAFSFCLWNSGTSDLGVSVTSPTDFSTSAIPADDVALNFTCGTTTDSVLLSALGTASVVDAGPLAAGTGQSCTVTATLNSSYTGSGGTVTPFELDFSGTPSTT